MIRVRDEGEGIPPGDLPRIFDRFTQIDGRRPGPTEVSGWGCISSESSPAAPAVRWRWTASKGRGTTFTVTLPIATPSAGSATPGDDDGLSSLRSDPPGPCGSITPMADDDRVGGAGAILPTGRPPDVRPRVLGPTGLREGAATPRDRLRARDPERVELRFRVLDQRGVPGRWDRDLAGHHRDPQPGAWAAVPLGPSAGGRAGDDRVRAGALRAPIPLRGAEDQRDRHA